jgi:hypothetical protein
VLEQIELSQALDYGGLAVLRDAWQRFGVPRLGFSWERGRFSGALFRRNWRVGNGAI